LYNGMGHQELADESKTLRYEFSQLCTSADLLRTGTFGEAGVSHNNTVQGFVCAFRNLACFFYSHLPTDFPQLQKDDLGAEEYLTDWPTRCPAPSHVLRDAKRAADKIHRFAASLLHCTSDSLEKSRKNARDSTPLRGWNPRAAGPSCRFRCRCSGRSRQDGDKAERQGETPLLPGFLGLHDTCTILPRIREFSGKYSKTWSSVTPEFDVSCDFLEAKQPVSPRSGCPFFIPLQSKGLGI
jgi:hypothetical protein